MHRDRAAGCVRLAAALLGLVALVGCDRPSNSPGAAPAEPATTPTFNKDIAPILFARCAPCHRPGQSAPFPLLQYADARPRAAVIARVTKAREMPPWLPDPGAPAFVGERVLTADQIGTIQRWVQTGAIQGRPEDLPPQPAWADGWELGPPDLVATLPKPYILRPGARDTYRNVVLPLRLASSVFVRAVEFRPGSAAVHHAVVRIDRTRMSRVRDGADGQPGFDGMQADEVQDPQGQFIGWAPGRGPIVAPEGMPWTLQQGSDLIVELHLLPGAAVLDVRPTIGLFLTKSPPTRTPVMLIMSSKTIDIPANNPNYAIEEAFQLPVDVDLLSVYPHAHYLGKEIRVRAVLPNGTTTSLLHIRKWSFHWQQDYRYASPITLPRGTTVTMNYTYDNSEANRNNPNRPPRRVMWGPQSSDEMGTLGMQVLPRSHDDELLLIRSFADREARADIAGAEMRVRNAPGNAEHQTALGTSYVRVGRYADATGHLEAAIQLDPRSANAHNYLGGALLALGRPDEALLHFRRASALAPRDEHLHFNLGKVLVDNGRVDEGAAEFERAISLNPSLAEAHQSLGMLLFGRNRLGDAISHLERAVELAPDSAGAESDLGGALAQAGRLDEALLHLRRALAIDPSHASARENVARLQSRGIP